ncbi:2:3-bisphosphoglycerate-independent phosphoglycerate mutase-like protein [Dinothrombium tinctorium]|uniref:phosphoglycerate mutase (2,3-diphosphoglycerate-independent) n=1 Tax=Dinothrombium tinctorium TaxID=1965070 RepID=A0A3S3PP19_9ACAR|nr:2:3-bisphosphoglycerate-independent phosphoglycerate mutase-like protein [Dinothrombium tinctorium]RWS13594.1 2:3-bisphosphoglycerate-independent phosphoglycerate mutase-like protein [Dinothrombium tinctorium]RWS13635.1 2:3-bisphosphoglycerate-independent phosphoglycerate mutase-like protein [Dinothrombium tinctorium]
MAKVCLIVIDGWGISEEKDGNAIANANTPVMDAFAKREGQYLTLDASGLSVGLPEGTMGNSEVGHLTIGSGRAIYTDLVRINFDVQNNTISQNENFVAACNSAKSNSNGRLHLLGLVSDGGVHAHINHLMALIDAAKLNQVPKLFIHFFSDGRDTSPTSGVTYLKQVLDKLKEVNYGSLATIMGRFYVMDRDKRWERIKIAFEGLVQGKGEKCDANSIIDLIKGRYNRAEKPETDEFLTPIIVNEEGIIQDNDTLIFINYRADRMREITESLGVQLNFETDKVPKNLHIYAMTQYKKEFPFPMLYPPTVPKNVLAETISSKNLPQFHCAETEKYAHVTFFFNGGQEKAFPLEDRFMVPSRKDKPTYDLVPEMSVAGVASEMVKAIESQKYNFVMCNFAPPDMVGHTGVYDAAVKACEATDIAIGNVLEACNKNGYVLLVTADHGNAEKMKDEKGGPFTAHTTNRVPFCMIGDKKFASVTHNASLGDVAPTVLDLMGIEIPKEMTGKSLLAK